MFFFWLSAFLFFWVVSIEGIQLLLVDTAVSIQDIGVFMLINMPFNLSVTHFHEGEEILLIL